MGQLYSALLLWFAGNPERALARAEEAVGCTDETTDPFSMAVALHHRGLLYFYHREGALLAPAADRLATLCADHGFVYFGILATALQGTAAVLTGDLEGGIAKLQDAWQALKAVGAKGGGTQWCTVLAEAYLSSGDIERALETIREALDFMNQSGERLWEPELHRVYGEVCASASAQRARACRSRANLDIEAEASFQTALRRSREMGARSFELRATTSLARYWSAK
jgi:predicted ATPase